MKSIRERIRESFDEDPTIYVIAGTLVAIVLLLITGATISSVYGKEDINKSSSHTQYVPMYQPAPIVIPRR